MSYVHHPKSILVDFPWVQITDFEYTRNEFSSEELSSILECMPNLVSLKLNAGSSITSSSFIVLPLLKTLTLDGYSWGEDDMNILDAFTAPHLNTLHLEVDLNSSSILQFLKRSQCKPEDIKLSGTPLDMEWMTQHSSLCEVRELCLYRPKSIIEDLRLLTRAGIHYSKERSDSVFPQLQKLTMLYVESETTNVVQCLIDMLESRLAHIQQFENSSNAGGSICFLQSLTVVFEEVLNQDEKDTLRAFIRSELVCQSGIVMTINHGRTRRFGHSTITTDVYSEDIIRDGVEPKEENTKFSRALSNSFEDFSVI
ncbi:hypothetical protein BDQ17DRAFT_1433694 [Cyathus striatus]|nr:hypothetical protein BDQ17DRAFT_1433694 [Cyathus striatus]